jgi:uncharacterized membrane protein
VQQYLSIWDLILTPVYLLVLIAIAKNRRDRKYPIGHPLRKYYLPGLYAKFGGALFIGLVYAFYYGGGDTFNYFSHASIINSSLSDSLSTWIKLIRHAPVETNPEIYAYTSQMFWYNADSEYTVSVITAIFGLFTNTSYFPTAILFAFFTYSGIWAMYTTFVQLYPKLVKPLAIAFLFIPSTLVWGSGIFKDTICMFGLGWMTYATFRLFINRDLSVKNLGLLALSFYLVAIIKLYILLGFIPALVLWLLLSYSRKIETAALRWIVNIFFIGLTIGGFAFFMQRFADELNKYSLEKLTRTAQITQMWTNYASGEEGSAYDIGKIDGTLEGTIALFPKAVVVTLFRPFPWEVKKLIAALSGLEALAILYLTLQMIFSRNSKPLKTLFRDPNVLFCLIFALIFAFAVGVSSGNFGALSRYKIPCLPFYGAVLAVMVGKTKKIETVRTSLVEKRVQVSI